MKIQDGGQTTRNGLGRPVSSGKGLSIVAVRMSLVDGSGSEEEEHG
jgi:hypothetical protein